MPQSDDVTVEFDDLTQASTSSTDFWDNAIDDADWNEVA
jgi:hypothetical protein